MSTNSLIFEFLDWTVTVKTADVNDTNNGFYNPGDLGGEVFKTAGDLEDNNSFKFSESKTVTDDEIKSYIASIQSGVRTYGSVSGGGVMFVSFDRLKDMVNSGYNIIRANYFENTKMIEVEFDVPVNHKSRWYFKNYYLGSSFFLFAKHLTTS